MPACCSATASRKRGKFWKKESPRPEEGSADSWKSPTHHGDLLFGKSNQAVKISLFRTRRAMEARLEELGIQQIA